MASLSKGTDQNDPRDCSHVHVRALNDAGTSKEMRAGTPSVSVRRGVSHGKANTYSKFTPYKSTSNVKKRRPSTSLRSVRREIHAGIVSVPNDDFVLINPKHLNHPPSLLSSPSLRFLTSALRPRCSPRRCLQLSGPDLVSPVKKQELNTNDSVAFQTPVPIFHGVNKENIPQIPNPIKFGELGAVEYLPRDRNSLLSDQDLLKHSLETNRPTGDTSRTLKNDDEFVLLNPNALNNPNDRPRVPTTSQRVKLRPRVPVRTS